jgi:hypothetical protein
MIRMSARKEHSIPEMVQRAGNRMTLPMAPLHQAFGESGRRQSVVGLAHAPGEQLAQLDRHVRMLVT